MDPASWLYPSNQSGLGSSSTNNPTFQLNQADDVAPNVTLGPASTAFFGSSGIGIPYSSTSLIIQNPDFTDPNSATSNSIGKLNFTDGFIHSNGEFLKNKHFLTGTNSWHVSSSSPFGVLPHQSILNSNFNEEGNIHSVHNITPMCHGGLNQSFCGGLMSAASLMSSASMLNSDMSVDVNHLLNMKEKCSESCSPKISYYPNSELNSLVSQSNNLNASSSVPSTSESLLGLHEHSMKQSFPFKHNVGSLISNLDTSSGLQYNLPTASGSDFQNTIPCDRDKSLDGLSVDGTTKANKNLHGSLGNPPFDCHSKSSDSSNALNLAKPQASGLVSPFMPSSVEANSSAKASCSSGYWDIKSVLESYMDLADANNSVNSAFVNPNCDLTKTSMLESSYSAGSVMNDDRKDSNIKFRFASDFCREIDMKSCENGLFNSSKGLNTLSSDYLGRKSITEKDSRHHEQLVTDKDLVSSDSVVLPLNKGKCMPSDIHPFHLFSKKSLEISSDTENTLASRLVNQNTQLKKLNKTSLPSIAKSRLKESVVCDVKPETKCDIIQPVSQGIPPEKNATSTPNKIVNFSTKMENEDNNSEINQSDTPGEKNNKIIVPDISEDFGFLDGLASPCNVSPRPSESSKNSEYLSNFLKFLKTDSSPGQIEPEGNEDKILSNYPHAPSVSYEVKCDSHESSPFRCNQKTRHKQVAKVSPLKHFQDVNEGGFTHASQSPLPKRQAKSRGRNVSYKNEKESPNLSDDEDIYVPARSRRKRGRRAGPTSSGRGRGRKRKIDGNYISPSHELERHDSAHKSQNKILSSISNFDTLQITSLCFGDNVFKAGDHVVLANDFIDYDIPSLWKICAEGVIQKFEPYMDGNSLLYRNTTNFTEWTNSIQSKFLPLEVDLVSSSDLSVVVIFPRDCCNRPLSDRGLRYSIQRTCYLRENFEVYIQTLISQALDSNFLTEIFREKDEYFVESVEKIDSVCSEKCKGLLSTTSWSKEFQEAVEIWPCLNVINSEDSRETCDACHSSGVQELIQMFGQTYHSMTLQNCAPSLQAFSRKSFKICSKCYDLLVMYSLLIHQKYNFYTKCASCVTLKKQQDPLKDTTRILNELLADDAWLNKLFREAQTLWARVELILHKYNSNS